MIISTVKSHMLHLVGKCIAHTAQYSLTLVFFGCNFGHISLLGPLHYINGKGHTQGGQCHNHNACTTIPLCHSYPLIWATYVPIIALKIGSSQSCHILCCRHLVLNHFWQVHVNKSGMAD